MAKMGRPRYPEFEHGRFDLNVSISAETYEELERLADAEKLTLSALVRILISDKLAERRGRVLPRPRPVRESLGGTQTA